jgi:hypothetical protein
MIQFEETGLEVSFMCQPICGLVHNKEDTDKRLTVMAKIRALEHLAECVQ